jgi:enoyl-CoA hydratase/carnithine racemase
LGLVTHISATDATVQEEAMALAQALAAKPPAALRATKRWLNELDGSFDDARFKAPVEDSRGLAAGAEAAAMLRSFWRARGSERSSP